MYSLSQPTLQETKAYFADISAAEKDELIEIYSGNIGMIKNALENPKRFEILQKAISAQKFIAQGESYELAKLLFGFNKKKEDFILFLKDLEFICDKKLSVANVNTMNAVTDCRSALARNANPALVMENFIIAVKNK
jgi:hypothetical protein